MATDVLGGSVVWNLDIDDKKFSSGIDSARSKVESLGDNLKSADRQISGFAENARSSFGSVADGLGRVLTGATALAIGGSFGFLSMTKAAYDQVKAVENATFALRAYERDGEKVTGILSELVSYARSDLGVLFQREELFKAAANLRGFGDAAEDIVGHVKILSKGVALGMTNFDELSQIIGRATSAGKLSAEQFDQLAYRGIVLDSSLRGASISADQLYKALDSAIDDKVLEGRATTIQGRLIRLQSAFRDLGSDILGVNKDTSTFIKGGLGDTFVSSLEKIRLSLKNPDLKASLQSLGQNVAKLAEVSIPILIVGFSFLVQHITEVVAGFGALNVAFAVAQIGQYVSSLVLFVGNMLAAKGAISATTAAQWGFNAAAAANPITLIVTASVAAVAALAYLQFRFDIFGKAWQAMQPIIGKVSDYIENRVERLKQIFEPFGNRVVQALADRMARARQILQEFGISLEFGGARSTIDSLPARFQFAIDRMGQILTPFKERAKQIGQEILNSLAGRTEGQDPATLFDALNGALDRLHPVLVAIKSTLSPVVAQLTLTGEIVKTQVAPAWTAFMETLKPLATSIWPLLKTALQGIGVLLAAVGVAILGLTIGFIGFATAIVAAIGNALPYVAQAVEGIIQVFRGFSQIMTGIFTRDFGLVIEGFKQMFKGGFDFVVNILHAFTAFIAGFIKGIITFFTDLYMQLVGGSIIPDMVNEIIAWFMKLPGALGDATIKTWESIIGEASQWPGRMFDWGKKMMQSFGDGIISAKDFVVNKVKDILNSAKKFVEGHSPPIAGPFKDIDKWGFNVGSAWVEGVQGAISGLSLPEMGSELSQPAYSSATDMGYGRSGDVNVNIQEMSVRSKSDIIQVGQEIGFRIGIDPRVFSD